MFGKSSSGLIDLLVEEGLLKKRQMKQITKTAAKMGKTTMEAILEAGKLERDVLEDFVDSLGIECVDLSTTEVDWSAVDRLGKEEFEGIPAVPVVFPGEELHVAVVDPLNIELANRLSEQLESPVVLVFGLPEAIRAALASEPRLQQQVEVSAHSIDFSDVISDETNYKAVDMLRSYTRAETEWRKPVIIVGAECVGKTHLLRAVQQELESNFPGLNIMFIAGPDLRADPSMLRTDRAPDGLLLDDLDSIAGDPRSEEIFMQAFNAVFQQQGPIVVSAKRPLGTIDDLATRLRAALAICRTTTLGKPRPETLEAIGRRVAARIDIDPDGVDWSTLIAESGEDLRRIIEALEAGRMVLVADRRLTGDRSKEGDQEKGELSAGAQEAEPTPATAMLREEAEAIIEEAKLAIDEIELQVPDGADETLGKAKVALAHAMEMLEAEDYVASEQLGMEALEKAALAHGQSDTLPEGSSEPQKPVEAKRRKSATADEVVDAIREAERAVREACDAGAEEYASKELRAAVEGLEEAKRLKGEKGRGGKRVFEEAMLASEKAADAARRAKTRREEARIKQEKEKVRRCQLATEEVKKEFERLIEEEKDTPIARQLDEAEIFIETAVQYQEVGSIGQALEQVMKARKRLGEIGEEAALRRELRTIINEVDALIRDADKKSDVHNPQQLNDIQNALAEAERVLMGDSADYELGLNWARVARQKAVRLMDGHVERHGLESARIGTATAEQSFETFEICEANQFVAAIARTAAETPHLVKSPLFVYGDVGVGKTHLLSAIHELVKAIHQSTNVVFATAADFAEEYREAVARGDTARFRDHYRKADILMVDDLHHVIDQVDALREFFHTLSAVEAHGGLVVVSAALPSNRLGVEDRSFASRLEGGVIAEVKNPSLEAREKILQRAAKKYDLDIPEEAISLLASMVTTNVRDLLGALGKVAARSRAAGGPVTGEIIRMVLREVLPAGGLEEEWRHS